LQPDRKVVLGVRPQDLELAASDAAGRARGRVWVVELLGSEKLVEVELGDKRRITVQIRADREMSVDQPVSVRLDPRCMHIFHVESGDALRSGASNRRA